MNEPESLSNVTTSQTDEPFPLLFVQAILSITTESHFHLFFWNHRVCTARWCVASRQHLVQIHRSSPASVRAFQIRFDILLLICRSITVSGRYVEHAFLQILGSFLLATSGFSRRPFPQSRTFTWPLPIPSLLVPKQSDPPSAVDLLLVLGALHHLLDFHRILPSLFTPSRSLLHGQLQARSLPSGQTCPPCPRFPKPKDPRLLPLCAARQSWTSLHLPALLCHVFPKTVIALAATLKKKLVLCCTPTICLSA